MLDAFSEREVAEYLAARIPAFAAEESFVRALHGRTDGLPLFVADVVSDLIAHGRVRHRRWIVHPRATGFNGGSGEPRPASSNIISSS